MVASRHRRPGRRLLPPAAASRFVRRARQWWLLARGWCVRNGYVQVNDLNALKVLIAETGRGLPYQREHFAQDHPDLFALLEPGKGENFRH
jgi:hypothetical protein